MKTYLPLLWILLAFISFSCEQEEDELGAKKKQLETYQKEAAVLQVKIEELGKEIAQSDPTFARTQRKSVLITTIRPEKDVFSHFVEVTGSVLSKKNVNISAEVSGRIEEIMALEGMRVKKGEELARIDSESIDRNIEEIQSQLELATTVFEKQERLWDQEIGTEIQFLEAKNRKENLEKNLASLNIQKNRTIIRSPFGGTVENLMIRLGELVQPGSPIMNFVGESDLYVEGDVSERYVGVLERGDSVRVFFPSLNHTVQTKVTAVGAVINPNNRTFKVEVFLPDIKHVKPNMLSVIRINDYENEQAVIIPNNLILQDNQGDYVFIVEEETAVKRYIERGRTYREKTEILEGLEGDEVLIDKGFREVGNNYKVNITE